MAWFDRDEVRTFLLIGFVLFVLPVLIAVAEGIWQGLRNIERPRAQTWGEIKRGFLQEWRSR